MPFAQNMPHSTIVLIALGVIVVLIVVVCVIAATVYRIRFVKLENESKKSVVDGGDRTAMSDVFSERYKNDGSVGLNPNDIL